MRRRLSRAAKKKPHPKTKLGLPHLDQAKAPVLGSLHSPESQRGYQHSINEFINWYCSEPRLSFNKTVVTRYRIHLGMRLGNWLTAEQARTLWQLPNAE